MTFHQLLQFSCAKGIRILGRNQLHSVTLNTKSLFICVPISLFNVLHHKAVPLIMLYFLEMHMSVFLFFKKGVIVSKIC